MDCEIITIGDEILIGQIVDTNSAWMAVALNEIGVSVKQISSVSDEATHITTALDEAKTRAQIILITGGLGPTKDDITKTTLQHYLGGEMVFNAAQFLEIERIFKSYGREVTAINRKQAEVPSTCTCLVNRNGTAPGMWFDTGSHIIVSMPGVPYEMKGLMQA
jgi:nicotinamide-nucleotide amidase